MKSKIPTGFSISTNELKFYKKHVRDSVVIETDINTIDFSP